MLGCRLLKHSQPAKGRVVLKAVTFDLWQTLILDTADGLRQARAGRIQGIHALLTQHGYAGEQTAVEQAYDAVGERLEGAWRAQRDIGSHGQVRILLDLLGLEESIAADSRVMEALEQAYCLPILSALPVANAGAAEILGALSERGMRLGLVCNTGRTPGTMLRIVLDRLGLARYLSVLTFSDEVGVRKPHPEIFLRTLAALGVSPEEAAHIGDDVTTDVAGARGIRMRAIHLCHARGASPAADVADAIPALHALPALLFPG